MKSIVATFACIPLLTISAQATESDLQFGDVTIARGMSVDSLRSKLPESLRLTCSEPELGVNVISCTLSAMNGSEAPVHLVVQNGHVLTASQGSAVPPSGFDTVMALYNLLSQLTQGQDTCAVIRVSQGPPPQFAIALPEKYISVYLHEHQRHVTMNVGLRQNPSPDIQLEDCWPESQSAEQAPPNHAMQRSALVVTPLADAVSGSRETQSASGAPTTRRR